MLLGCNQQQSASLATPQEHLRQPLCRTSTAVVLCKRHRYWPTNTARNISCGKKACTPQCMYGRNPLNGTVMGLPLCARQGPPQPTTCRCRGTLETSVQFYASV